eukprot:TRINITY_DN3477_c0_g1_i4.p1 TRINITY_DN3477_c0_g1~~TRINITY_DN3477_c0_g1_i4.p1  ORF type:complete len:173 (-),score=4.20 TRINITY_DN3477_c0_g1_i4:61-579(-)
MNKFINNDLFYAKLFIALNSLCVDITILSTLGGWVFTSTSLRWVTTVGLFYSVRGLLQSTFFMRFPEGYLWIYPGFPSLTVPYGQTSDFFYSGHCGMVFICTLELRKVGRYKTSYFGVFTLISTALTLIVTRTHYSIDIFTGVFFAHYLYLQVSDNIHRLDHRVQNLSLIHI